MDMTEAINVIADAAVRLSCKALFNAKLSDCTTIKIGGTVPLLINVNSVDSLTCLLKLIKIYGVTFMVIGNGSNLLFDDKEHSFIILRMNGDFAEIKVNGEFLDCAPGAMLSSVCRVAARRSLSGLEQLFGIPGSIGGAVFMNAGAYGREISDVIDSVTTINADGVTKTYSAAECLFSYRESVFIHNREIITHIRLKLTRGKSDIIKSQMESYTARRKEKQPLEFPSAGSAFKRPKGAYASALIDECGLKGLSVGGAMVSEKHAGFIINTGNATFADVLSLMKKIIGIVELQTGFKLEPEPIIVSDNILKI
ncbi:MAG: UDP-N-acetylmuramate dehydrogenase [Ruminococcus sp.]|jgi:UDP-N-acetylmuramate dehydrogenase|nr:UDP-N-acetylmuramate dehydrogenase [Ruminococcus sp.]